MDLAKYDILKFWVLGKDKVPTNHGLVKKLTRFILRQPLSHTETVYRRVIAAVRMKKSEKLTLKAFKDIPVVDLEKVLPVGSIKMGKYDRYMILASASLVSLGLLANIVTKLAKMTISWPLMFAGLTSLLGVKGYFAYRSRVNNYLTKLNQTLYYKNIANNRGLITLVVDRAQDESFKEALLTYAFVHAWNRGPAADSFSVDTPSGLVDFLVELYFQFHKIIV